MADFRCFDVSFVSDQTAVSRSGQSVASDSASSAQASGQTAVSRSGQSDDTVLSRTADNAVSILELWRDSEVIEERPLVSEESVVRLPPHNDILYDLYGSLEFL